MVVLTTNVDMESESAAKSVHFLKDKDNRLVVGFPVCEASQILHVIDFANATRSPINVVDGEDSGLLFAIDIARRMAVFGLGFDQAKAASIADGYEEVESDLLHEISAIGEVKLK